MGACHGTYLDWRLQCTAQPQRDGQGMKCRVHRCDWWLTLAPVPPTHRPHRSSPACTSFGERERREYKARQERKEKKNSREFGMNRNGCETTQHNTTQHREASRRTSAQTRSLSLSGATLWYSPSSHSVHGSQASGPGSDLKVPLQSKHNNRGTAKERQMRPEGVKAKEVFM